MTRIFSAVPRNFLRDSERVNVTDSGVSCPLNPVSGPCFDARTLADHIEKASDSEAMYGETRDGRVGVYLSMDDWKSVVDLIRKAGNVRT